MLDRGLLVLVMAVLVGGLVGACSSYDSGGPEGSDVAGPATLLSPEEYAAVIESGERFVVNVHTPDEGQLAGTDVAIAFDELEPRSDELPEDRKTGLAIYCMSGNMSETAAETLSAMGYDDIVDLRGGMEAWRASGREIEPSSR